MRLAVCERAIRRSGGRGQGHAGKYWSTSLVLSDHEQQVRARNDMPPIDCARIARSCIICLVLSSNDVPSFPLPHPGPPHPLVRIMWTIANRTIRCSDAALKVTVGSRSISQTRYAMLRPTAAYHLAGITFSPSSLLRPRQSWSPSQPSCQTYLKPRPPSWLNRLLIQMTKVSSSRALTIWTDGRPPSSSAGFGYTHS